MITESIKLNSDDIINYLFKIGFNNNYEICVTEFCPYGEGRRIDLFYFSRWNRETRGYEIKISRADFLKDKKWEDYLKYCTCFYFVVPRGIIKSEELPSGIGLIEIEVIEEDESVYQFHYNQGEREEGQKIYEIKHRFVKRAKKIHDVAEKEYIQLLEGLLIKIMYSKSKMKILNDN